MAKSKITNHKLAEDPCYAALKFRSGGREMNSARRQWLVGFSNLGAGAILIGCNKAGTSGSNETRVEKEGEEAEVTATEDLMREHGILRRILLVYQETATRLSGNASIPPEPLQKAAKLFRVFGEEYHEKKLEETYIFPAVRKAAGEAAGYADVLIAQHTRGREITDYIISITQGAKLSANNADALARSLEAFVLMY